MHYYQRHIGDYMRDTGHLSHLEHGSYTVLLDYYYSTEKPLPANDAELRRVCRVTSKMEREAVARVLERFFKLTGKGWVHKRVEMELALHRLKTAEASAAGKKSAEIRAAARREAEQKVNGDSTTVGTDGQPSQYPLTINHEPLRDDAPAEAWAERIVAAYPRKDHPLQAMGCVLVAIRAGQDPGELFALVQLCARHMEQAPGGSSNRLVPSAKAFFEGRQWASPEAFENRWSADRKKNRGGRAANEDDGPADNFVGGGLEPAWDWRALWLARFGFGAPAWEAVPDDNRKEMHLVMLHEPAGEWRGVLMGLCEAMGSDSSNVADVAWTAVPEKLRVETLCVLWKKKGGAP